MKEKNFDRKKIQKNFPLQKKIVSKSSETYAIFFTERLFFIPRDRSLGLTQTFKELESNS